MLAKPLSHVASALLLLTSIAAAAPGDLDTAFLTNLGEGITGENHPTHNPPGAQNAVALQPDGKILVAGSRSRFNNTGELTALKRLNADGTLDTSFGPSNTYLAGPHDSNPEYSSEINAILVNPDGSFYIGGMFNSYGNPAQARSCVAKVNADGTLDTTFTPPALSGAARYVMSLALDGRGGLLVGGTFFTTGKSNLIRLDAATGALDTSFMANDLSVQYTVIDGISPGADGRLLVSGALSTGRPFVYRLFADGVRDTSFQVGFANEFGRVNKVLALPDGRVLFGGGFTLSGRPEGDNLAAVDGNGALDSAFMAQLGTGSTGWMGGVLQLTPDGRILAGGIFNSFNGASAASLVMLGLDGARDLSFAPPAYTAEVGYLTHMYSAAVQPDGKILACGWFDRISDPELELRNLVRFEGDSAVAGAGTLAFSATTVTTAENAGSVVLRVVRRPGLSGAVSVNYATGGGTAVAGTHYTDTNGTLDWADGEGGVKTIQVPILDNDATAADKTFLVTLSGATGGAVLGANPATVTILDDEAAPEITTPPADITLNQGNGFTLSVAFSSVTPVSFQWQFDAGGGFGNLDGATGSTFTVAGATPEGHGGNYRVVLTNLGGSVISEAAAVTVLTPDGSLIPSFSTTGLPAQVRHAAPAANGKTIIVTSNNQLRRLNADGSLDGTFTVSAFGNAVEDLLVLPDQRILVTGYFTTVTSPSTGSPAARLILARFNADGSFDSAYNPTLPEKAGEINGVYGTQLAHGAGGKFYVGFYGGAGLWRYNADGSVDSSFTSPANLAGDFQGQVRALRELDNGKVLVSHLSGRNGFGFTYNFWRLNADGSRDLSFTDPGAVTNTINAIDLLPDGRIAVAGNFTGFSTISPVPMRNVALLLSNGQVDLTFQSPVPDSTIEQIHYHNGRLLISGYFANFTNPVTAAGRVARLNLDGSVDTSFVTGSGANNRVSALFIGADGQLFLGGDFTSFNGIGRNYTAKLLLNDGLGSVGFDPARVTVTEEGRELELTVHRYGPADAAVSIDWAAAEIAEGGADTPANVGDDFAEAFGTLVWEAGDSTSRTITLTLLDDAEQEPTEVFQVVLSNPSGPVTAAANATIRLLDSDTPVTFSQQPNGASLIAGGTLNLSAVASSPTPVSFQWLRNGQPVAGATSASFSKAGIAVAEAGVYVLEATNAAGSFLSDPALVVVQPTPSGLAESWPLNLTINVAGNVNAGSVRAIVPTSDGGAYIGGDFTNFNGQTGFSYLVKISSTGVVDTTFNPAPNGYIDELALHDGKLFVLGSFTQIGAGASLNNSGGKMFAALDAATGALLGSYMTNLGSGAQSFKEIACLTVLSDGDLLLGGDFTTFNGSGNHKFFARINPDGTLDGDFNSSAATGTASYVVRALGAAADGGFYAGGITISVTDGVNPRSRFVKFNADGSYDPSFNPQGMGSQTSFTRIRVLDDGRIMATGTRLPPSNRTITRVSATGAWDNSEFSGTTSGSFNDFVLLASGRSIGIGSFSFLRNPSTLGSTANLASFTTTGAYDGTWPSGDGLNGVGIAIEIATNGEVWIGGEFTAYNGVPVQRLLRLAGEPTDPAIVNPPVAQAVNPDATAFFSVGAAGTNLSYQWFKDDMPLEDGGNISGATTAILTITDATLADDDLYHVEVTGGTPENTVASEPVRLRLLGAPEIATAQPDLTPAAGATVTLAPEVYAATPATYVWTRDGVVIQNGGRYSGANTATLVIEGATNADNGVYLLTITNDYGSDTTSATVTVAPTIAHARDATYSALSVSSSSQNTVRAFVPLTDGRMLVAVRGNISGTTGGSNSNSSNLVIVEADGRISNLPGGGANGYVYGLHRQPDGKILVAGAFNTLSGQSRNVLARLNADLTLDTAFNPSPLVSLNPPSSMVTDTAGRIYLGGLFFNYDGRTGANYLVRLLPDGTFDPSFDQIPNNTVQALAVQPDGSILVAGIFTQVDTQTVNGLFRLTPEGEFDSSFTPGHPASTAILALTCDAAGRIYVGTNWSDYAVRRLLPDGDVDPSFTPPASFANTINRIVVQPDGKILVGGGFTSPTGRLIRLNEDGSVDAGFEVGTGFNSEVSSLALDDLGRIWVGGFFTQYQGVAANRILVLQGDSAPRFQFINEPLGRIADLGAALVQFQASATGNNGFTFQWRKNGVPMVNDDHVSGVDTDTLSLSDITLGDAAEYSVTLSHAGGTLTSRPALLTVLSTPEILSDPAALTLDVGATAVFTGSARGAGTLNYQWFHFDTALSDGDGVSGATTPTLTLSNVGFPRAGDYRLRVTNHLGEAFTEWARLTVERRPGALASGVGITSAGQVYALLKLSDGSILVGGGFTSLTINGSNVSRNRLARFLANGTLDTAFNPNIPSTVRAIAQDSSGRVFIAGDFNGSVTIGGVTANRNRVARLTSALVLDTAFDTSTVGPNDNLTALAPTENGGVYIGGDYDFNKFGTDTVNRIARLKADGSLDTGFTAAAPAINNEVFGLLRRADGKLYAGGIFGTRLLNANGSHDTGFVPAAPTFLGVQAEKFRLLADGSLLVSGNGVIPQGYLRRLNANTGENIQDYSSQHSYKVVGIAQQPDGKIISGSITGFARSNLAGEVDTGFSTFNNTVNDIVLDDSGRIWVGGSFNAYGATAVSGLAVLNGGNYEVRDGQLASQTLTFAPIADRAFNPVANSFTVNPSSSSGLPVTVSVTSGPATVSGNMVTITGAGEVTLTASQAGDDTYAPATLVRSFTVARGQQTISFNAPSDRAAASAPFNLNASASSGLPVSFELLSGPASLDGNTLTLSGELGTVVLAASQDGDANWEPAEPVERSFEALDVPPVTLPQVLSFPKLPAKRFLSESPVALVASASSGLDVTFEVLSGPATVAGNVLTFTGLGKVTVRASQAGGPGFHPAASITQSFTIAADPTKLTFTNLVQVYDGTPREVGVVGNGEDPVITYVINGVEGPNAPVHAGSYAVIATADGKTLKGKLVVNKAPLTVTPDSQRRFIGEENPTFTLGYTGFQGDDTRESVFAEPGAREPTASTAAKATSPGGVYPIKPAGGLLANYAFVYVSGSLTVESFAGRYEALLTDAGRNVAKLELTVAASSTVFTGKLSLAGEVAPLSIKGTLTVDAEAETATGAMTPVTSKSGVLYELTLDFILGDGFSAELNADDAPLAATDEGRRLYTPAKGDVITFAGTHTLILEPAAGGTPAGSGYGLAAIDGKAVMKLAGRLGDGTPYTAALMPDEQSGYRLFVQPYKRANSYLAGPLDLEEHPNLQGRRYLSTEASALLDWEKVGIAKDKSYRDGFGPDSVQVTLDPWLKPDKTTSLASLLDLEGGGDFQVLHGAIGSESDLDLPTDLQLDAKNKILITAPVTDPVNVTKWKAALNAGTGLILGSFQVTDEIDAPTAKNPDATKRIARKVSFIGVLRQPHGTSGPLGRGHALVPALPSDETNEIRAENVEFEW